MARPSIFLSVFFFFFFFFFGNNSQIKTGLLLTNWKRLKIMLGLGVIALVVRDLCWESHS
jgi:hypothetical protein